MFHDGIIPIPAKLCVVSSPHRGNEMHFYRAFESYASILWSHWLRQPCLGLPRINCGFISVGLYLKFRQKQPISNEFSPFPITGLGIRTSRRVKMIEDDFMEEFKNI